MFFTPIFLLQLGLGFVFIWTGILIFKDVPGWATMIKDSWVHTLLPTSPNATMRLVAIFDIVVGIWLIVGFALWLSSLLAALHLLSVLLVSGIMGPTYRDVGLLTVALSLLWLSQIPLG